MRGICTAKANTASADLNSEHGVAQKPEKTDHCEFELLLLAMACHDFRQPLQIIQYAHDRLGDGARTRSDFHLLRQSQRAIDRLAEQLDQLLDALRLRVHANGAQKAPVELGMILHEIYKENEWAALQKGVQLRMVPTTSSVISDSVLLGAALRNLIGNAIKFTPPGGRVLFGCRHAGDDIRIDVLDTGIGISEEQIPKIFEAFARLDSAQADGLGIGLFIVRHAIATLGHRMDLSSIVSRGTRFSILARRACGSSTCMSRDLKTARNEDGRTEATEAEKPNPNCR
jgi:two-component system, OmpR family, phosphate regulon sensor histidine kinase PhoR